MSVYEFVASSAWLHFVFGLVVGGILREIHWRYFKK
jgi:hypothetical protein